MHSLSLSTPVDPRLPWVRTIRALDDARSLQRASEKRRALEAGGKQLGDALRQGPRVLAVRTLPTTLAPYPTRFAFNGTVPERLPGGYC